ncbi:MAG: methyltransferase domain-containing protein [Limnospira sp. PMC 737.11]|uniref:Methyltransferase domain-containing protein n=1 Tax=Limnospira fusiformis PMC 851.14 TaxID=2219512 RepID=A0ABU9EV97_LIMFS|nr:methyltransferase domain-containing protein [Limnospira sp. PMC 737.11]MDT9275759.1 methyltransferase domain-containing protein [Limnospira sp. PMC 737.11]
MSTINESDLQRKIREQFDFTLYPRIPIETSPKTDYERLYIHNLLTPYYLRNQQVIQTEGKVILDAGCGSGYKALALALANPGAKIVGIDISEKSVEASRDRLKYHGIENAEFHAMYIEELPSLGWEFDYINNDEVLYLLPDIVEGLQAMKSVLKPDGIIRTNLHSAFQRQNFFKSQEFFKMIGLMDEQPGEMQMEMARETMKSLKDQVLLKQQTWNTKNAELEEYLLSNHLLLGDKGFTIPDVFAALKAADLEFISMLNWRHWEIMDLFKDEDDLPVFLGLGLAEMSTEDRLHLFELLQPMHRLLDFWCGHPHQGKDFIPVSEWSDSDWKTARVSLHPQLANPQSREDLINCITNHKPFEISKYIRLPVFLPIHLDSGIAACLLPLWERVCTVEELVQRWQQIRPIDPITLEPVSQEKARDEIKELLDTLDPFLYVLLERCG